MTDDQLQLPNVDKKKTGRQNLILLFLALLLAAYGGGRLQGYMEVKKLKADLKQEYKKYAALDQGKQAADMELSLYRVDVRLQRAQSEVVRRNFGKAQQEIQSAYADLKHYNTGKNPTLLQFLEQLRNTNILAADNLNPQAQLQELRQHLAQFLSVSAF